MNKFALGLFVLLFGASVARADAAMAELYESIAVAYEQAANDLRTAAVRLDERADHCSAQKRFQEPLSFTPATALCSRCRTAGSDRRTQKRTGYPGAPSRRGWCNR